LAGSLINPSNLDEWIQSIRLDFTSLDGFALSLGNWLSDAPTGVIVAAAATTIAVLAFARRPGAAAFIVLAALGVLGAIAWTN
jgi:hypothetical protein